MIYRPNDRDLNIAVADARKNNAEESHVHFMQSDSEGSHELDIIIEKKSDSVQEVHLGFLKLNHHYVIQFSITDDLGEDISADPLQNLHCRVTSCVPTDDGEGHTINLEFHAYKDKLVNEFLVLTNADNSKSLTLKLMARVLGKNKGTPMIRNGIKCVGIDADEDSEQSDWAGFN